MTYPPGTHVSVSLDVSWAGLGGRMGVAVDLPTEPLYTPVDVGGSVWWVLDRHLEGEDQT